MAVLILAHWCFFYALPFNIPDKIPATPIKLNGLALCIICFFPILFFEKSALKSNDTLGIMALTLWGTLVGVWAEAFFKLFQLLVLWDTTFIEAVKAILVIGSYDAVFAFLIAFQLKTHKTKVLIWMIVGFVVLTNIIVRLWMR